MNEIKDFIYLDMNKVSSLYSQLIGGIIQSTETSSSSSSNNRNLRNYNFKVFKHDAGGTQTDSNNLKEIRISHHDVYNELEEELFKNGYAAEIGKDVTKDDISSGKAVEIFESALCIKAEGHVVLEDYERITRIAENYEDVTKFINESILSTLKENPEFEDFFTQIEIQKEAIKKLKKGQRKSKEKELHKYEKQLNDLISDKIVGNVDDWIIEGLRTWVNVFLKGVFNLRLYPFLDVYDFHIMSKLNRNCFLEDDTESVHHLFGSKPTVKLSMLGIITSIPQKEDDQFEPMKEFEKQDLEQEGNEGLAFENGFRGVFRGFDGLEDMIRTCRYPRIMVQPIAIYRSIKLRFKFEVRQKLSTKQYLCGCFVSMSFPWS